MPIFFASWIMVLAVMMTFFSEWHNQIWQTIAHWFLYVLPFLALWIGIGLAQMKFRIMAFIGSLTLFVYAVGIYNFFTNQQFIQPVYAVPWRSIFNTLHENAKPNATVICTGVEKSCWYYAELYGYPTALPWEIERKGGKQPSEVWWVHSNVGGIRYERQAIDQKFLKLAGELYQSTDISVYGQHEASIRWLKTRLMGHTDYGYQVVVYHFYLPDRPRNSN